MCHQGYQFKRVHKTLPLQQWPLVLIALPDDPEKELGANAIVVEVGVMVECKLLVRLCNRQH
jgi:hypothetical protein